VPHEPLPRSGVEIQSAIQLLQQAIQSTR
jgi:hypothetical protein